MDKKLKLLDAEVNYELDSGDMRSYGQFCGLARALDRVGDRWTLLIVRELLLGPRRYSDLRANLPGIATNLLAERLRMLEAEGLLRREELPPPAPAVVYELTQAGRELEPMILGLIRWGGRYMTPAGEDTFRAEWVQLAIRALLEHPPADASVRAQLWAGDTPLHLSVEDGRVSLERAEEDAPVTVRAAPEELLGLFAGRIPLERLDATGRTRALEKLIAAL